jgi:vancomycin resistance protein YoaR
VRRALLAGALLAVAAATTAGVLAASDNPVRTAPGTTLGALDLAGLDRSALRDRIERAVEQGADTVTVRLGSQRSTVAAKDLGIGIDVDATADRVLARSGTARKWGVLPAGRGHAVGPLLDVDEALLQRTLTTLQGVGTRAATPGALAWDGRTLRAQAPRDGQSVEAGQLRTALLQAVARVPLPAEVVVPVVTVPTSVRVADVEAVAARGRALLADPPVLQAGKRSVTVSAQDLGPLLSLQAQGDLVTLGLTTDHALATRLAGRLSIAAVEPQLDAPVPATLLEAKGSATWDPVPATVTLVALGKAGQDVTPAAVLDALADLQPGRQPVPSTVAPPKSSAAGVGSIDAVLGTFTTRFSCCQARVHNIQLMARTLDETLVPPGGSFSINDIVGPRTTAKGYLDAPYIFEGELSTDIGGGVSQVGTTTLNAAFFAGVRLDEHKAHSFYISRYPTGREATLNYPNLDVRWTNTTSSPIFVRTKATSTSLTVTLYGHDDGRTVEAISGERQPVAGRDFRIRITRLLHLPDGTVRRDGFTTTYNKPPKGH